MSSSAMSSSAMSSSLSPDPGLDLLEQPPCPKCHSPMMLTNITSGPKGSYTRTFECLICGYCEKVAGKEPTPVDGNIVGGLPVA